MSRTEVARRLASLYDSRGLRNYVRWKVAADPAYEAVLHELRARNEPLVDLGCGIGLLAFFLRENGFTAPITGIDFDQRKIDAARRASKYDDVDFIATDVRAPLPQSHDVVMLDILHYLDPPSQQQVLANAARASSFVIIRQGIRDRSWRYRLTSAVDALGRAMRWMKAEHLTYPAREDIVRAFDGFTHEITPLRGRTPYNNYLFVFRKAASSGMTNE